MLRTQHAAKEVESSIRCGEKAGPMESFRSLADESYARGIWR